MLHDLLTAEADAHDGPDRTCSSPAGVFREEAYAVGAALQRVACIALFDSRERFEEAFIALAAALPAPSGKVEAMWLREKLMNASHRAAVAFHRQQHCDVAGCALPPVEQFHPLWNRARSSPRVSTLRWLAGFLAAFDRCHRRIGTPVRTARLLRHSWRVRRSAEDLARFLGSSKSVIERRFVERYGLTPKAYHTRVRVRAAVLHLRHSTDKVEYVARRAGYPGVGHFYATLERCTGVTPSALRSLGHAEFEALLSDALEIRVAALARGRQTDGKCRSERRPSSAVQRRSPAVWGDI